MKMIKKFASKYKHYSQYNKPKEFEGILPTFAEAQLTSAWLETKVGLHFDGDKVQELLSEVSACVELGKREADTTDIITNKSSWERWVGEALAGGGRGRACTAGHTG
jgi:hypothetical protein